MIISSTSWTADEDFGILLTALELLDKRTSSLSESEFPNLLVVVTGKGPQKEMYLEKIRQLAFKRIRIATMYVNRSVSLARQEAAAAEEAGAETIQPQAAERQEDGARARVQGRRTWLPPGQRRVKADARSVLCAARQGQRGRGLGQAPVGDQQAAAGPRAGRQEDEEAHGAAAAAQDVGGARQEAQARAGRTGRVQHYQPFPHAPQEVRRAQGQQPAHHHQVGWASAGERGGELTYVVGDAV
ncbi:unnamed protein product [Phytophthora lilii]|uniref:Unnamed protein product n=1 Tax=Phytophthora lilii TaxID=2077276 RepID=A0A9W6TCV2_9STRA|nr:unnamed protein product [Phytophthora lilii]